MIYSPRVSGFFRTRCPRVSYRVEWLYLKKVEHGHSTRGAKNNFFVSHSDRRSIKCVAPQVWNSLPTRMKQSPSIASFKNGSKLDLLAPYGRFSCAERGCRSCAGLPVWFFAFLLGPLAIFSAFVPCNILPMRAVASSLLCLGFFWLILLPWYGSFMVVMRALSCYGFSLFNWLWIGRWL